LIAIDYPDLLKTIEKHLIPGRTESASFLAWYLENYYRLDHTEAVDAVCDDSNDKGVDGIYVNENEGVIEIFQSKISQTPQSTVGDKPLREFRGTLTQFKDEASVENLVTSAGAAKVAQLVQRTKVTGLIGKYELKGVFLSNINLDANGQAFLNETPEIAFIGKDFLSTTYIPDQRAALPERQTQFDVSGYQMGEYIVDGDTRTLIAPIKAFDLANLSGIQDQSLFDYNVRGSLGRTQVNKDIVKSIRDPKLHKLFPLFHNGITIVCEKITDTPEQIELQNYSVVNGCQSLTALFQNRKYITGDLRVLTKIIQLGKGSLLSETITHYSNNQNGVKARDFKANHPTQIRLQNEFKQFYGGQYGYEIKRGEALGTGEVISNEDAGLYLMSFDLKEPWATPRAYQVFDDKHADLFGRPEVTADRILLCHLLAEVAVTRLQDLENQLFAKYTLTKYAIMYMLRRILEQDPTGKQLIQNPTTFVREEQPRAKLDACIDAITKDTMIDINAEVASYGEDFDYRDSLRNQDWVTRLANEVVNSHVKLVARGRLPSFTQQWGS